MSITVWKQRYTHIQKNVTRWIHQAFIQHLVLLVASTLLATSVGVWFLGTAHAGLAKGISFEDCATALPQEKQRLCTGADPVLGGCTFDAQTVTTRPLLVGNRPVGRAELRHSPFCQTYWVRGFSYLKGTRVSVLVVNLGQQPDASFLSSTVEAYSNMIYATKPTVTVDVILSSTQIATTTIAGAP